MQNKLVLRPRYLSISILTYIVLITIFYALIFSVMYNCQFRNIQLSIIYNRSSSSSQRTIDQWATLHRWRNGNILICESSVFSTPSPLSILSNVPTNSLSSPVITLAWNIKHDKVTDYHGNRHIQYLSHERFWELWGKPDIKTIT